MTALCVCQCLHFPFPMYHSNKKLNGAETVGVDDKGSGGHTSDASAAAAHPSPQCHPRILPRHHEDTKPTLMTHNRKGSTGATADPVKSCCCFYFWGLCDVSVLAHQWVCPLDSIALWWKVNWIHKWSCGWHFTVALPLTAVNLLLLSKCCFWAQHVKQTKMPIRHQINS